MTVIDPLRVHAERIRSSGVLGRSRLTERLFDYLLECSISGKAPKEIEVAVDVFGKDGRFDVSQDAMVRVYIHKLRRKLDEFYEGAGKGEAQRIVIPKGAYRFSLENAALAVVDEIAPPEVSVPRFAQAWQFAVLGIAIVISAVIGAAVYAKFAQPRDSLQAVREHPVWSKILDDDRPIFVVVGDYYIFGETDETMEIKRLVREFGINSPQDLDRHVQMHPELEDRYQDLEMAYLPTASAFALSDVMPVLAATGRRTRVAMMSELNPATLKSAHVIYVGYLSGLGMLQDLIFAGSRFYVGETYDELIDSKTNRNYVSQVGSPIRGESKYHDYGYFSTFAGPSGNQIVIIAGTRDVAVMQTAEMLTQKPALDALIDEAGQSQGFEALYQVYGIDRLNLDGKLLLASPLNTSSIWSDEPYQAHAR